MATRPSLRGERILHPNARTAADPRVHAHVGAGRAERTLKRAFDIAAAFAALVVLSPLLIALAVIVKLDSRGPVLFKQERLGRDLKPFTMYKFRSMQHNAGDALHRESVKRTAESKRREIGTFKSLADPRVTKFGRFIRAWNLDELPNLLNILRGEMSVVGPRPALDYELPYYKDWYYKRFAVRPGLTGLWQVKRADAEDFDEMIRMDVEYVRDMSLGLDLKLIALTIPSIVRERGAF
jgi:lipopolysaccharide/colanic/teichoic acid biosynthesis glycosyltransferase